MIFTYASVKYTFVTVFILQLRLCDSAPDYSFGRFFTIAGIFDTGETEDPTLLRSLRHAIERCNNDVQFPLRTRLRLETTSVFKDDTFSAQKKLCFMLKNGANAVVGPLSAKTSWQMQSTCNALQVPHVALHEDNRRRKNESGVNIHPQSAALAKAVAATISEWEWFKEFAILYETNEALNRVEELFKLQNKVFTIHRVYPDKDSRPFLKAIKKSGVARMVIDASLDTIRDLFIQLKSLHMITEYYEYVIINLDMHTMDLTEYRKPAVNVTGFQILDPQVQSNHDILTTWRLMSGDISNVVSRDITTPEQTITTEMALAYDTILVYAAAIKQLETSRGLLDIRSHSCELYGFQNKFGLKLINALRKVNITGLTGPIFFDKYGLRSSLNIHVVTSMYTGLLRVATWNAETGLTHNINRTELDRLMHEYLGQVHNLTVTTFLNPPLFMRIENPVEGGPIYEGYVVDLVQAISKHVGRNFTIRPVLDHAYGSNTTGEWNGMVGELIRKKADIAVADLAITRERQDAVDFSIPFMNLGIGILFKKESQRDHNLFSFLDPFAPDVWIYVGTSCIGVSVLMFTLARISPTEWDNPHPCDADPEELENQFNLMNSFWFVIGTLLQQGCDFLPKAASTRTLASIWWFFVLITVATYTAGLAASLAASQMSASITSATDLSKQFKVKYGCVNGGATYNFFKKSQSAVYQIMSRTMETADPSVFVEDNTQGINRVLRGDYAFFMESVFIEYQTERLCDLMPIGGTLDSKGYGVGLPKGSPYYNEINQAVLYLQDHGVLLELKKKWFQDQGGIQSCPAAVSVMDQLKLGIGNVGGVFVLVIMGVILALLVGVMEFTWFTYKNAREPKGLVWKDVARELKFAIKCGDNTKPITKSLSDGDNIAMTSYSSAIFGKDPLFAQAT